MAEGVAFGSRYILGDVLGRGAMGRVYRASVRDSEDAVAVKVLRDDLSSQPDVVARFIQERQVLRAVSNPNVVTVRDLVVEGDQLGIVMDLVEGGNLRTAVHFPMSAGEALGLVEQISTGLAAVHAAGVVHRDLKPENVLADRDADGGLLLRLTDFGVSRLVGQTLTKVTSLIGTPGYLAPEVAAGERPTSAADVYALGVLLYEMLCGRGPFEAENVLALIRAHAEDPPPRPVGMPDELWVLTSSMLAKAPERRPTAQQIAIEAAPLALLVGGCGSFEVPGPQPTLNRQLLPTAADGTATEESLTLLRRVESNPNVSASDGVTVVAGGGRSRSRRMPVLVVAALVAFVSGLAGVWLVNRPAGGVAASPESSLYSFPPTVYPGATVLTRQWELVGTDGSLLRSTAVLTNSGTEPAKGDHFEVIPKSVADDVDLVRFTPAPDEIVQRDPVVRYSLDGLAPAAQVTISWEVSIPADGNTAERLRSLARDQQQAAQEFTATMPAASLLELASMSINPSTLTLDPGLTRLLVVTGEMSDGSVAGPEVLAGISWTSSNTAVATVDQAGSVSALAGGAITITAQAGAISVTADVTVNGLVSAADNAVATLTLVPASGQSVTATTRPPVAAPPSTVAPSTTRPVTATTRPPSTSASATTPPPTTTGPTAPAAPSISGNVNGTAIAWSWSVSSTGNRPLQRYDVFLNGGLVQQGTQTTFAQSGNYSTTYTLQVIVYNSAGLTAQASLQRSTGAAPTPTRTIQTFMAGPAASAPFPDANYVGISGQNFTPGASLQVLCEGSPTWYNLGNADSSGSFSKQALCWHTPGTPQGITVRDGSGQASATSSW